jgi:hypothetical protein
MGCGRQNKYEGGKETADHLSIFDAVGGLRNPQLGARHLVALRSRTWFYGEQRDWLWESMWAVRKKDSMP